MIFSERCSVICVVHVDSQLCLAIMSSVGDKFDYLERLYVNDSKPGSYLGAEKIYYDLKRSDDPIAKAITLKDVEMFLEKQKFYYPYTRSRKSLAKGVSSTYFESSGPNEWWQADGMYLTIQPRFVGRYEKALVCYDVFSRKIFARPAVKLDSGIAARLFTEIVNEQNDGVYPRHLLTDRGSEFKLMFDVELKRHGVKHVWTSGNSESKAAGAERSIGTLKMMLQRLRVNGVSNFNVALTTALNSYNNSVHSLTKLTPNESARIENVSRVVSAQQEARAGEMFKYRKRIASLNKRFKIGDVVRKRVIKTKMDKGTARGWSDEEYRVSEVLQYEPLYRYKLVAPENGDAELNGTFTVFDLKLVRK